MSVLVVGGTSGLGLELARDFADNDNEVIVTGSYDPKEEKLEYQHLHLSDPMVFQKIGELVMKLPKVKTLVYGADYYEEGTVTDLSVGRIREMDMYCYNALVIFTKAILYQQKRLPELITVTSTSQFTPQKKEPTYAAAKAAAGIYSKSLAKDRRLDKVLVAAPAGTRNEFRDAISIDNSNDGDLAYVAQEIMREREEDFRYRFIKVPKRPLKVEVIETR